MFSGYVKNTKITAEEKDLVPSLWKHNESQSSTQFKLEIQ